MISLRVNGMSLAGKTARAFNYTPMIVFMKGIGKRTKGTAGDV